MKKLFAAFLCTGVLTAGVFAQCTPISCLPTPQPYGGICDTVLMNGNVNTAYSDFESFHATNNCFNAGVINPSYNGYGAVISTVQSFSYTGLPAGINGNTNAPSYTAPAAGCIAFSGTPTQAGVFDIHANFTLNGIVYPFGGGLCTGFSTAANNIALFYSIDLTILPDASFTLLADTVCTNSGLQTLTVTGTPGGTFTGPGVSGTTFNPLTAGAGTHTLTYAVSAQQGAAVAPAANNSSLTIVVVTPNTFYVDADNDSYGDNSAAPSSLCASVAPAGYSVNNLDCDDGNSGIHPGALEIPANSVDEDCDGSDAAVDADNDGFNNTIDCNDNDSTIYPGAPELCDGVDNDCDLVVDDSITFITYYQDMDGDTYGNPAVTQAACTLPVGYVTNSADCNDNNSAVHPAAAEVCDGVDNNCNNQTDELLPLTTYYLDADGDTYGTNSTTIQSCLVTAPAGYAAAGNDCDDTDPAIHPGAADALGNGTDENCDGADGMLGIETENPFNLYVYPNPASEVLQITGSLNGAVQLQMYTMSGTLVLQTRLQFTNVYTLPVSTLPAGFYILSITRSETGDTAHVRVAISR